jgi:hypothetical protein
MILSEEIYFEINFKGEKSEIKKLAKYLKSGELDDFFEVTSDYIIYGDNYAAAEDGADVDMTFTNDDLGIELDELDAEELAELISKAAKALEVSGHIYDINDEELSFRSEKGDSYFVNSRGTVRFNDELDEAAKNEESDEDEE